MSKVYSPGMIAAALTDLWSPQVLAEVDDAYIKVAKVEGTLTWRSHDGEDDPRSRRLWRIWASMSPTPTISPVSSCAIWPDR